MQIRKSVVKQRKAIKKYPRQTYNELIMDLVNQAKSGRDQTKEHNQYNAFLHEIQEQKMKELWDNAEDEAWENV